MAGMDAGRPDDIFTTICEVGLIDRLFSCLTMKDMFAFAKINQSMENYVLSYIRRMKTVDFKRTPVTGLTFDEMNHLSNSTRNCRRLFAPFCHQLAPVWHINFIRNNKETLRAVDFGGTRLLRESIVTKLFACKALTHLSIRQCENINCSTIVELANSCPNLQFLDLTECNVQQFNDQGIANIVAAAPK